MNLKQQLEIQALYSAKAETPAKPEKADKPRSTLGPFDAIQAKDETETQAETPPPVSRGRPRKAN